MPNLGGQKTFVAAQCAPRPPSLTEDRDFIGTTASNNIADGCAAIAVISVPEYHCCKSPAREFCHQHSLGFRKHWGQNGFCVLAIDAYECVLWCTAFIEESHASIRAASSNEFGAKIIGKW